MNRPSAARRRAARGTLALAAAASVATASTACSSDDQLDESRPVIDVFAPYRGVEADLFADVLAGFEDRVGVDVRYVGSADFVQDLVGRLVGDQRPDVAIVPQPGLVRLLDDRGLLVEHGAATVAELESSGLDVDTLTLGLGDVAVPYRSTIKSLVWYRPDVFAEHDWEVPATLDELAELVDEIDAGDSGLAPWCFSISSGTATGWPATDWIEDVVLRQQGPEVYDDWRDGRIGFTDPRIVEAFEFVSSLLLGQTRVAGGRRSLLQTDVIETGLPLFGAVPECAMYKQASFAYDWFPDSPELGPGGDVDVFVLPGMTGGEPAPLVVGGDSVVAFDDRPEVDRLMAYLASADGSADWASAGGFLSSRTDVDADRYYPEAARPLVDLLVGDGLVRFDASDAMEPEFGSDTFWTEMTAWMGGTRELTTVLERLDAARAESLGS